MYQFYWLGQTWHRACQDVRFETARRKLEGKIMVIIAISHNIGIIISMEIMWISRLPPYVTEHSYDGRISLWFIPAHRDNITNEREPESLEKPAILKMARSGHSRVHAWFRLNKLALSTPAALATLMINSNVLNIISNLNPQMPSRRSSSLITLSYPYQALWHYQHYISNKIVTITSEISTTQQPTVAFVSRILNILEVLFVI